MNTFGCNYENYNEETYKWFVEPQCRVERTCAPEYDCFEGGCSLDRFNVINGERKYWCYLKGTNPYQSTTCEDIEISDVLCRDCQTTENPNGAKHDWFISYEICNTQIAALQAEQLAEATCQMEADCVSPGCVYNGVTDVYECRLKNAAEAGGGLVLGDIALTSCTDVVESGSEDVDNVLQKIGKSVQICDAFAATMEAEKTCSPEVNCLHPCQPDNPTDATAYDHPKLTCTAEDDSCILQRSWCELKNSGLDDSCADAKDSNGDIIGTQLYNDAVATDSKIISFDICDAQTAKFASDAAALEAAEAEAKARQAALAAGKTCEPHQNCVEQTGNNCVLDDTGSENRYYCQLKAVDITVDSVTTSFTDDVASSCSDITEEDYEVSRTNTWGTSAQDKYCGGNRWYDVGDSTFDYQSGTTVDLTACKTRCETDDDCWGITMHDTNTDGTYDRCITCTSTTFNSDAGEAAPPTWTSHADYISIALTRDIVMGKKYYSDEVCDAYGAKQEAGLTCAAEANCVSGESSCTKRTNGKYACATGNANANSCSDNVDLDGTLVSYEICEAYGAKIEAGLAATAAASAEVDALKTCNIAINCVDDSNGHACQASTQGAVTTYSCRLKTGAELFVDDAVYEPLKDLSAQDASSCKSEVRGQDVDGAGDTITTYQSTEICDAYAALAEAGFTCIREKNCVTACEYDAALSGSKYKCKIADYGVGTACTDWDDHKTEKTAFIPATLASAEVQAAAAYTSYHVVYSGTCAAAGYVSVTDGTECATTAFQGTYGVQDFMGRCKDTGSNTAAYTSLTSKADCEAATCTDLCPLTWHTLQTYNYGNGGECQRTGAYLYSNADYDANSWKVCKFNHPEVQYAAAVYNDDAVAATYNYYSVEVCDAYGALKQAERAELDAMRTCSVSANCKDDTSSDGVNHKCQVRKVLEGIDYVNEYYCELKGGFFTGHEDTVYGADTFSVCGDITETSTGSGVFESKEICSGYGAKVEAGHTCVADNDCASACSLDQWTGGANPVNAYICILNNEVDNACTDVTTYTYSFSDTVESERLAWEAVGGTVTYGLVGDDDATVLQVDRPSNTINTLEGCKLYAESIGQTWDEQTYGS
jgi:hypothetical protein